MKPSVQSFNINYICGSCPFSTTDTPNESHSRPLTLSWWPPGTPGSLLKCNSGDLHHLRWSHLSTASPPSLPGGRKSRVVIYIYNTSQNLTSLPPNFPNKDSVQAFPDKETLPTSIYILLHIHNTYYYYILHITLQFFFYVKHAKCFINSGPDRTFQFLNIYQNYFLKMYINEGSWNLRVWEDLLIPWGSTADLLHLIQQVLHWEAVPHGRLFVIIFSPLTPDGGKNVVHLKGSTGLLTAV